MSGVILFLPGLFTSVFILFALLLLLTLLLLLLGLLVLLLLPLMMTPAPPDNNALTISSSCSDGYTVHQRNVKPSKQFGYILYVP
jgi:hypothetical protein